MLSPRAARALSRGTTSGVVALAVAGFAMSYDALHALAVEQGVSASLAWLWPLVVDGFIVVASLTVVRAVAEGRRAVYPWLLVLAFSGISVAFNVVHAAPTPVARLVAAVPPAALVLSFELLMRQLRAALRSTTVPVAVQRETARAPETPALTAPTTTRRSEAASSLAARAREVHDRYRAMGRKVTGAVLARELDISDGYGRRLLRQLATDSEPVGDVA